MPILNNGMEAALLHLPLLRCSNTKETPMSSTFKIIDRIALTFFTALAMFPVLTVAVGGVFY